jgi:tRNA(Phe) wybutosine-synthesizing methylase Tyw3
MTPEERFERIEAGMERLVALQENNQKMLGSLIASVDTLVDPSNAYMIESRERMKRLEENLDALIRAITMEHQNRKGKG